jgi:uncharacterized repeat protein (TIGR03803 family)
MLHSFPQDDEAAPNGLVQGRDGNFYGTTFSGGGQNYNPDTGEYGYGTVFQFSTNGTVTTLYSFTGGADGSNPLAALVQGSDGRFYGTTEYGGAYGLGAVFAFSPDSTLTTLYSFTGGADGAEPVCALVQGTCGQHLCH